MLATKTVIKTGKLVDDGQVVPFEVSRQEPVLIKDNMNDYSWSEIKDLIQSGHADKFEVEDTKDITLNLPKGSYDLEAGKYFSNAVSGTYKVVVLGINHNSELEGTNRVHFCIGQDANEKGIAFSYMKMNTSQTSEGGWAGCPMRTWLNNTLINGLPSDLASVITPCTKYTNNTGVSNLEADVTATSDKLWLLSEFEVHGKISSIYYTYANYYERNKQVQYDYYKKGARKGRYTHEDTVNLDAWWLRSVRRDKSGIFSCVGYNGVPSAGWADRPYGVVPCFTIS